MRRFRLLPRWAEHPPDTLGYQALGQQVRRAPTGGSPSLAGWLRRGGVSGRGRLLRLAGMGPASLVLLRWGIPRWPPGTGRHAGRPGEPGQARRGSRRAGGYRRARAFRCAWALGDCAAVPDLAASAGSVASLGLHRGVAEVYGLRMRGFPAWMTHRIYHLLRLPTMNRRLRVVADWTLALLFPREVVSLDVLEHPRPDSQAALHVIAAGPSGATPIPGRGERKAEDHACHR